MEIFYSVSLLVVAAVAANIIYTEWPQIPLAFYQIGAGLLLSFLPLFHHYVLYPEMFMLIIIAPLLFSDGQSTNFRNLQHSVNQVLSLSVGLALVTAVGIGILTHLIYPTLPLALTFALAAIITPTDSVALGSITSDLEVPSGLNSALENESLFNDASGIVIFDLALVAFSTGNFSLTNGLKSFAVSFIGGLVLGGLLGYFFTEVQSWFIKQSMDTTSVIVPFSIMTPFAIYLVAETFGCSGILADVAAGIVFGIARNRLRLTSTNVQVVSNATWSILVNVLNGFVFVLLGVTLPTVIANVANYSSMQIRLLVFLAIILYVMMVIIRYVWVRLGGGKIHYTNNRNHRGRNSRMRPSSKDSFIMAVSGIHGTITLSMALSIPLTLSGHSFPFRNELIFLAAMVILLSLLMPTLVLPLLLPKVTQLDQDSIATYRNQMVDYSIQQLKNNTTANPHDRDYVIDTLISQKGQQVDRKQVMQLMQQTIQTVQQTLTDLSNQGQIDTKVANIIAQRASMSSKRHFSNYLRFWLKHFSPKSLKTRRKFRERKQTILEYSKTEAGKKNIADFQNQMKLAENTSFKNVSKLLAQIETKENASAVAFIRRFYNVQHERINNSEADNDRRIQLFISALQNEYSYVADQYAQKNITKEQADQLNQSISTDQLVYMQNISDAEG
ncbi:sodium:proton antiporter [Lentilactobacillus senioris]|uniref:cation:proton antiporter n=1 Tax=Lentilactobacillus senioris TaxID=931534 RepID=UPI0022819DF3|nr:sodium:proton antiporter [Lentilactobacillus senioris]MCY9806298.1 sodium:proton antiporter [Lentilactobacillus senioris]